MAYSIDAEIKLISRKATGRRPNGAPTYEVKDHLVPCKVESVSQSEYFEAGQAGIEAEYVFIINPINYAKETRLEYEGAVLRVYRTYRRAMDELELHAAREKGLNGDSNLQ